jgi:hypothetical protein
VLHSRRASSLQRGVNSVIPCVTCPPGVSATGPFAGQTVHRHIEPSKPSVAKQLRSLAPASSEGIMRRSQKPLCLGRLAGHSRSAPSARTLRGSRLRLSQRCGCRLFLVKPLLGY